MPQRRRPQRHGRFAAAPPIGGPHELGQNWLVDRRFPAEMAEILRHAPPYPVLELGAGNGALTEALVAIGSDVTALELDPRRVGRLRRRFAGRAEIVEADMLTFDFGPKPHHVIANVPFSVTTPLLRRLLRQDHWDTAVLLLQWEVARKRAGVGGTTMLTASWWPWYELSLGSRVPAAAFTPVPTVDGGILVIRRRASPLVPSEERTNYQDLVRHAFTGRGRGLRAILRKHLPDRVVEDWMSRQRLDGRTLPRDLKSDDWASLFGLHRQFRSSRSTSSRNTVRTVSRREQLDSQAKQPRGSTS
jgi:23S rRNA (adenine-N6)-dimethyltransferase